MLCLPVANEITVNENRNILTDKNVFLGVVSFINHVRGRCSANVKISGKAGRNLKLVSSTYI